MNCNKCGTEVLDTSSGICSQCSVNELSKNKQTKLYGAVEEFTQKMENYKVHDTDGLAIEAWIILFKQLLKEQ